jgi:TRAP-type mannitol/chloroaromatic compound transport system permease large subunit
MPFSDKLKVLKAGITPFLIFFFMTGLFIMGITSLVESSAVGATASTIAAFAKKG